MARTAKQAVARGSDGGLGMAAALWELGGGDGGSAVRTANGTVPRGGRRWRGGELGGGG